ncbi:MAG: ATP synthase F1 subunit delta [Proteobacteria bacterium]|nr:MAG: ATP synthase F1 subunit delta [Pseudomonadota bacterium]
MSSEKIAKRYAKALMSLANGDQALQGRFDEQLAAIEELFQDKEVRKVISSPIVNPDLLKAVFDNVSAQIGASDVLKQFINLLVETRRTAVLPEIAAAFHKLYLTELGQTEATVVTAVALEPKEFEEIQAKVEEMLGKRVILSTQIDKSILGGFVIKIDNNLIDMSLRTKLDNMTKFAVS